MNRIIEIKTLAKLKVNNLTRLRKMLEENNLNTIETIKKEYGTTQSELEKKHQVNLRKLKSFLFK